MNYCVNCGNTLQPGQAFCDKCGHPTQNVSYNQIYSTQKNRNKGIKFGITCVAIVIIGISAFFTVKQYLKVNNTLKKYDDLREENHNNTMQEIENLKNDALESESNSQEPANSVTTEQRNALEQAKLYAEYLNMSKQAIYDQLISEYGGKFSAADAQYAIDNLVVDWNANALATAKSYSDNLNLSKKAIYDQLMSPYGEKFTKEQAQYAIDHLDD